MVNVSRLRYWFAAATILIVVVVAGFYVYARYRFFSAVKDVPAKLGVEIQQSTDTFSLSKSEGGRTLFTIRASKALQYKQGGRAELHNVSIVVYGRESNRFDQIYGDDFEYDPQSGNVVAKGVVHIDLEANPQPEAHPELGPPGELKNPIHLKTSGLVFNQKSGLAKTDEEIAFQIPQASGSARGAYYDSKSNTLTLASDINVQTSGPGATKVTARHGLITKDPRRAVLDNVVVERSDSTMTAHKATLFLRDDNSLERVLADGDVDTKAPGETGLTTHSPRAEFFMNTKNQMRSAVMTGGVTFETTGANHILGNAGRVVTDFGSDVKVQTVHASEGVRILQKPSSAPATVIASSPHLVRAKARDTSKAPDDVVELTAMAMDFFVKGGRVLDRAETLGSGQITIVPQGPQARLGSGPTVVSAGKFTAEFNSNRLSGIHGGLGTRVVQTTPGQADRISTSDRLEAAFDRTGGISGFVQQGNFQYHEGQPGAKVNRAAWADKATYSNASQTLILEGSPRVTDGGMATTAQSIRLNRATGDAEAQNSVKTTYSELAPHSGGALLASGDPVHVTAAKMVFTRSTGIARYTGDARLWQGANIVEAPSINFDRDKRAMEAQSTANKAVTTILVQQDKKGNLVPVNVSAARLFYADQQRQVRFEGGVTMRSTDGTVTADHVTVLLKSREAATASKAVAPPSQVDRIVAEGHVLIQQPNRRGTGEKLVYTANDGRFVMTGGPPQIVDAQQGTVTGAALTFYSHDDKVLVEGGGSNRAVTTTRVSK
jgi:lipopolysaccharide export system protein LptA